MCPTYRSVFSDRCALTSLPHFLHCGLNAYDAAPASCKTIITASLGQPLSTDIPCGLAPDVCSTSAKVRFKVCVSTLSAPRTITPC